MWVREFAQVILSGSNSMSRAELFYFHPHQERGKYYASVRVGDVGDVDFRESHVFILFVMTAAGVRCK